MYKKKLTLSYPPLFTVFGGLSYYYFFFFSSVFVLTRSHTRFDRDDYFMVLEFVFFFFSRHGRAKFLLFGTRFARAFLCYELALDSSAKRNANISIKPFFNFDFQSDSLAAVPRAR